MCNCVCHDSDLGVVIVAAFTSGIVISALLLYIFTQAYGNFLVREYVKSMEARRSSDGGVHLRSRTVLREISADSRERSLVRRRDPGVPNLQDGVIEASFD